MAFPISVGDVMLLSSLAWKIGCAFTSGRAGAPAEFREVENELQSLRTSLNALNNTLEEDDSILLRANRRTVDGLETILSSCSETLNNLDSLVTQYQEIRKTEGNHGISPPRIWRGSVLRNYRKLLWTSEGGNIQALRNMLEMHIGSINMLIQALQSQSLARLENIVHPLATKVDGIHDTLVGNIDIKIAEMHNLIMTKSTPGTSPSLGPLSRRDTVSSLADTLVAESIRNPSPPFASLEGRLKSDANLSVSGSNSSPNFGEEPSGCKHEQSSSRNSIESRTQISGASSPTSTPYEIPPTVFADSQMAHNDNFPELREAQIIPTLNLPKPAITTSELDSALRLHSLSLVQSEVPNAGPVTPTDATEFETDEVRLPRAATAGQHEAFKHAVFDNAITLCHGVGTSVDYIQRIEREDFPKEDATKVVQAAKQCSISLVTKMRSNSLGRTRHTTGIWVMSEDRSVRLQQQLDDEEEIIPYTIWGNTANVVLRTRAELKFHDTDLDDKPLLTAKTSWVNYHFQTDKESMIFQSALMWKRLIYSFRTRRTMLAHEGFVMSTFSFQEQLCVFENLRLWRDEEASSTIAMIHYSPNFHEGYLSFRLSGPGTVAKVVDDGDKWVKIKKLNIVLEPKTGSLSPSGALPSPEPGGRKKPETKKIAAIRVEFSTTKEKYKFLEVYSKARER